MSYSFHFGDIILVAMFRIAFTLKCVLYTQTLLSILTLLSLIYKPWTDNRLSIISSGISLEVKKLLYRLVKKRIKPCK